MWHGTPRNSLIHRCGATVRARLGAMRYAGAAQPEKPNLDIACFYDATANQGAYVLWIKPGCCRSPFCDSLDGMKIPPVHVVETEAFPSAVG